MTEEQDLFGVCPYVTVQKLLAGKWAILVLYHLRAGRLRFGQLQRKLPMVTQATLTKQLRQLEESGMLLRHVYAEVPSRVEYELSAIGRAFLPVLEQFELFGRKYIAAVCPGAPASEEGEAWAE